MSNQDSSPPVGFRVIPGYPRYAIDEYGNVLSIFPRNVLGKNRPWSDARRIAFIKEKHGYNQVDLSHNGHRKRIFVHTLVLETFIGPRPEGMECRHLNGCKTNNHIGNLAWGTASENYHDKVLHGTANIGENNGIAKLTANDVLEIRVRATNGETQASIANGFNVNQSAISKIVRREHWKHI